MSSNVIILRSVWGKVGMVYTINPCPDPKTGRFCKYVKKINSQGDMILTDAEKNSEDYPYFIPENKEFKVEDGATFDLNDPYQNAEWEAIKHCPLIAMNRYAKDSNGNYLIDGNVKYRGTSPRNGVAELFVDIPGVETEARVNKTKKIYEASKLIFEDSVEGRLLKTRLLGKHMESSPDSDITEYLLEIAKRNPDKINRIYNGAEAKYRLLLMAAKDKNIIMRRNNLYMYGDEIILGATDDAATTWLMDKDNKRVVEMIKKDTYPEMELDKKDSNTKK